MCIQAVEKNKYLVTEIKRMPVGSSNKKKYHGDVPCECPLCNKVFFPENIPDGIKQFHSHLNNKHKFKFARHYL